MRNDRGALLPSELRQEWEKGREEDRAALRELKRRLEQLKKDDDETAR